MGGEGGKGERTVRGRQGGRVDGTLYIGGRDGNEDKRSWAISLPYGIWRTRLSKWGRRRIRKRRKLSNVKEKMRGRRGRKLGQSMAAWVWRKEGGGGTRKGRRLEIFEKVFRAR